MKSRKLMFVTAMTLFAVLATPVRMPAKEHARYTLADLGTLGGPNSFIPMPVGIELTNTSTVVGESDTSIPDPYFPNCFQATCLVNHTFVWQKDVLTDLGALPGVNSSIPFATNTRDQTVGGSENGVIDPLTGFPEFRAVLWQNGQVLDLGTLGGNNALAANINNRGQVVGGAQNTTPDSFGFCLQPFTAFFPTQVHAFRWEDGVMLDLGTLGGNDSCAYLLNEHGQIGGFSYTNSIPNPTTGIPTQHPFLWENGKLSDLGTLGGTFGAPTFLNNRGQVVGLSNLAGDLKAHAFIWNRGVLTDLGTLGGIFSEAVWLNDVGEVVGVSTNAGDQLLAFLWKDGVMTNLGTVDGDPCSVALGINATSQVVGISQTCDFTVQHAFLWEKGRMIDLNIFVPPGSGLELTVAVTINDRGEIGATGTLPDGDVHAFLLIPCDENHPNVEGCDYSLVDVPDAVGQTNTAVRDVPSGTFPQSLRRRMNRYHFPGSAVGPRN